VDIVPRPDAIIVTLDKIDLIDRKFSQTLLGYSRDEVDRLVAEAAETVGRLAEEKMALVRTVEELRREVAAYQGREATIGDTLLTTQKIVEDLKIEARQEAENILDEARDKAAALVREAEERIVSLGREIDALRLRKGALISRFRDMLMATLDILDTETVADTRASGNGEQENSPFLFAEQGAEEVVSADMAEEAEEETTEDFACGEPSADVADVVSK